MFMAPSYSSLTQTNSLTFDDEFATFSESLNGDTGTWMTEYPYWGSEHTFSGSDEAEYYSDPSIGVDPFSVSNGVLSITSTPATGANANPLGLPYNSGLITTYKSFGQLYGYFEVRAELPAGQGLWPAFWMLPVDLQSPTELDVFEVLGSQPNVLYATTHGRAGVLTAVNVANTSTSFHTYGVDWEPQTTTFYMDGVAIAQVATPSDMNVPMFMLLNLAVGGVGSWPGAPSTATSFPASMRIDYVRAYATSGTVGFTDPDPTPPPFILPVLQAPALPGTSWVAVTVQHYGNEDPGSPQAGIGVALLDSAGNVVATGVTNQNGSVGFSGLAAGIYALRYILPASYRLQAGDLADISTGLTSSFTLLDGRGVSLWNQKVLSQAELAGTIQLNGAPEEGVSVYLLDSAGARLAITTTDTAGRFSFWVQAGTYSVSYTAPSMAAPTNSPAVTLADGEAFLLEPAHLSSPDTTPPSLTATESLSGLTRATSVGLSGVVSDTLSSISGVEVYDAYNGHTIKLGAATVGSNGSWTFSTTGLANGTHQFSVIATDAVGNTSAPVSTGPAVTVDTIAPQPVIKIITGNRDGGVTFAGVSEANSTVTVTDAINGSLTSLGSATTSSNGAWQLTSHTLINTSSVNTFSATAHDLSGNTGAMPGALFLSSTGADTLSATGASDVFAIMSFKGSDVINGFRPTLTAGLVHDYIDFSGRGIVSFNQIQGMISGTNSAIINLGSGKIVTLADISSTLLSASDFRFS